MTDSSDIDGKLKQITAVESQKSNPDRVNLYLDGEFALGVDYEVFSVSGLKTGAYVTAAELEQLQQSDAVKKATNDALLLLSFRARSQREISQRLRQKGFEPETIELVIEKLQEWRYLDDTEFARQWIENRDQHRPRGKRLLESELFAKGVDRESIRSALDERSAEDSELALQAAQRRLQSLSGLPPQVRQKRLQDFLIRRGFDYTTVRAVVKEFEQNASPSDDDLSADSVID